jgi:hypothetical protein
MWRLTHVLWGPLASFVFALSIYASPPTAFKPVAPHGAEAKRDQLAGRWYGNMRTKDGKTRRWLTDRKLDGTYRIEFVVIERDGALLRQTEFGDWGVSGNYFVTVTRGVQDKDGSIAPDTQSSYFWDVYKIVRLGSKEFVYQNVSSGNKFIVRRVDSSFVIPDI